MTSNIRRQAPRVAMSVIAIVAAVMAGSAPAAPQDEILRSGHFTVSIEGVDGSSADVVTAEVDPIEIEMHDVTQSQDPTWRELENGPVHFGEARFTFRTRDQAFNKDLSSWFDEIVARGDAARRTITIAILDRRGREARRYILRDSYPVALAPSGSLDLHAGACRKCPQSDALGLLVVQIGSVDIAGANAPPEPDGDDDRRGGSAQSADQLLRYKGFTVEIQGVDGAPSEVDSSWTSIRGGALMTEMVEATVGNDGERTFTPGKPYVSDLTLTGYMTTSRKALLQWMQNSARGKGPLRVCLTIKPIRLNGLPGPARLYCRSLITRIQIPRLSAGSAEPIEEVVVIRPERYEPA